MTYESGKMATLELIIFSFIPFVHSNRITLSNIMTILYKVALGIACN